METFKLLVKRFLQVSLASVIALFIVNVLLLLIKDLIISLQEIMK